MKKSTLASVDLFIFTVQLAVSVVNIAAEGFRQEQQSDDRRRRRDNDRIPEAVINIPGRRDHGEGGDGQETTEPARQIADSPL